MDFAFAGAAAPRACTAFARFHSGLGEPVLLLLAQPAVVAVWGGRPPADVFAVAGSLRAAVCASRIDASFAVRVKVWAAVLPVWGLVRTLCCCGGRLPVGASPGEGSGGMTAAGAEEKQWVPAWALEGKDGGWSLEWEVPGATRYEVHRYGNGAADGDGSAVVSQAEAVADLVLPAPDGLGSGELIVLAYADGSPLPMAISAIGSGDPNAPADIAGRLHQWQQWSQLSPHKDNTKVKQGDEQVSTEGGVRRTKQSWTLTKNPEEVITFDPNVNLCYPGAIVQARHALSSGYLVSAQIEDSDRADLGITVDALTGRRQVASPPSGTRVTEAIGKVVGEDVAGSSDIVYRYTEAYSSAETALELGVSAKYGGFAAKLDVEAKRQEKHNTVMVFLREKAFTAFCDTSTPGALFKPSFTEEKLARLVSIGAMGPDNPPLLVNSVSYGRLLVFSLTSTATEREIKAALKASYSGFADLEADAKAHHKEVLSKSEISIIGKSITPDMVKELLDKGSLKDHFANPQKYNSYGRLGYTLQTLDGIPAKMSEVTSYDAVSWGQDTTEVTLQVHMLATPFGPTEDFGITIDGEDFTVAAGKPATKKRSFNPDSSGDPFHITKLVYGPTFTVDWKLSAKELGWFNDGSSKANGWYPDAGVRVNYTATK
ncbi:thiol-activated cytolysin family protein [Streptomyces sp. NPDC046876]|uniref:thiol-activated cytolysin family protein n=1 Tax=Streptomyces sp. NPDC046876 TaxID=3155616 RepID=UPI0033F2264B